MTPTSKRRQTEATRVRPVGEGGDGADWGVVRLETKSNGAKAVARLKPCATCPWRKDAAIGFFPAEAYRVSANTAYDGSMSTFACHDSGKENPATCAGFLLVNAANNMGVRFAQMDGRLDVDRVGNPDGVALYASYRDMAIANGVDPDDPRLAPCRGDNESGLAVRDRMVRTGAFQPRDPDEFVRYMTDEDETDL